MAPPAGPESPLDPGAELSREEHLEILRALELTRACEDRWEALFADGRVETAGTRSLGQEAGPVGCAHALTRRADGTGDIIAQSPRALGALLLMGATPLECFRNADGRTGGPSEGRNPGLLFTDLGRGFVNPVAPLGTMMGVMAGVTLSFALRREERVGMVFYGDGATSTGAWHEGLAFAAARRCPLVVVVEANRWAGATPTRGQTRLGSFAAKAPGYGIGGESVDGNEVLAVRAAAARAVAAARRGDGPRLLELRTYRRAGAGPLGGVDPAPLEEREAWARRDPIESYRAHLLASEILDVEEINGVAAAARTVAFEASEEALRDAATLDPVGVR